MDAAPLLARVAGLLERHALQAVLIGNAAAALQGAPVTTVDLDFLFRKTPSNIRKLKAITADLGAVLLRPYYPASDLFRISHEDQLLQIDFLGTIHGIRSFEGLRKRAQTVRFGRVKSGAKGPLHAPAIGPCWRCWRRPLRKRRVTRKKKLETLKNETEVALRDQIRRQLALPPERRTHFLRKRIGIGMSCL
jgi:hypothetical protein